ncbi:DUF6443 domain-containing protein, partial [Aquiflexum sp. LQ15W]|uniref:DUF6443 domain-containing protein n=1 Tax=Cognataquiflexum nitidum TaxID=2922272 RepID=UPI001F13C119
MKNLILIFTLVFASSLVGISQTNTQNYVATHKFRVETTSVNPWLQNKENVLTTIQYVDGLGRPIETVAKQGSSHGKDLVVPVVYDAFGREATKYLPYTQNSTNGAFVSISTAISNQAAFYNDAELLGLNESASAFTKLTYEASPRNLVVQEFGPGKDWQVTNVKPVKQEYLTNINGTGTGQEQVIAWTINGSGNPVRMAAVAGYILTGGYYTSGQLSVKSTTDENGNISREYTDKSGRLILKKIYEAGNIQALNSHINWNQTYYVYDALGNLRFVFQPALSHNLSLNTTNVPTALDLGQQAFEYKYDSRNRMIAKRVPGTTWVEMVYDPFDRVVLIRDGNQTGLKWTFTKYDFLNRPILTGTYLHTGTRETVQTLVNSFYAILSNPRFDSYNSSGPVEKYTNNSFPKQHQSGAIISSQDLFSVNYYDNYGFTALAAPVGAQVTKAKGQLTGTKTKILGTSNFLTAVTWYDDRYRVLKSHSENHLNGNDQITLEYFNKVRGEVKKQTHINLSNGVVNTIVEEFQYNHLGQMVSASHKLNSNEVKYISAVTYDKYGRMSVNSLGNGTQKMDYKYNIRGWLSSINGGATTFNDTHDVFGMDLKYQNATSGFQQFNGNIGQILWKNTGGVGVNQNVQEYRFTYDKLNRLKDADYLSTARNNHFNEKGISYDKNGNILALQRRNSNTLIDNLTYTYQGNQLTRVTDAAANVMGFADGANLTTEYTYDPVGNMISDKNKKVTVTYNHLNLPDQVLKENGDYVRFTYDAAGVKRKSETKTGTVIATRDYVGNFVFANGQLEHIIHPEGRVVLESGVPKYEYFLKDHLG